MAEFPCLADRVSILRQLEIFAELRRNEIEFISEKGYFVEYKKGSTIYKTGDPPDAFNCIIYGRVKISSSLEASPALQYLGPGGYFGFISLLTGEAHSVTAVMVNDGLLFRVPRESFFEVLGAVPRLAIHLSWSLSRRLKRKDLGPKVVFESSILGIYSSRPGIHSWYYAGNLAYSLHKETGKNVVLVDLACPPHQLASLFGPGGAIEAVSIESAFINESDIRRSLFRHPAGFSLLCPHIKTPEGLSSLLSLLANEFSFIILLVPPATSPLSYKALLQSDMIHWLVGSDCPAETEVLASLKEGLPDYAKRLYGICVGGLEKPSGVLGTKVKIFANLALPEATLHKPLIAQEEPYNEYSRAIRRIARQLGGVRVGLVLGSGAALGLAHIGVLKVLEEEAVPIDIVAGCSIGAFISCLWAMGFNSQQLAEIVIQKKINFRLFSLRDLTFHYAGFVSDQRLMSLLCRYLNQKTFQDLRLPLRIVSCDLKSHQAVVFQEGRLLEAVRASVSLPGIFKPLQYNGMCLVDGAVIEPLPTSVLLKEGIARIIAVNTLPSAEDLQEACRNRDSTRSSGRPGWLKGLQERFKPSIFDILVSSMQASESLLAQVSANQADVVIHPSLGSFSWCDFFNAARLIEEGERAARLRLAQIKELVSQ